MIRGSIVALVTPMTEDGSIDFTSLSQLIDWHIAEGTDAIVSVGTTGESATLNVKEHCQVIASTVKQVAGRIPVIAGTGANSTSEAIEWTAAAKEAGAQACLLVTPYYNKPSQKGLYKHYRAIAEAVDIPQILYNVPSRTACDMLPETVLELAKIPNIVGVKEATGDLARAQSLVDARPQNFAIYAGDDATACEFILSGCDGNISVTANVVPRLMHEMCALALDGKRDEAQAINEKMLPLHNALFLESNPVPVKWALATMGRMPSGIRLPLIEFDSAYHQPLREALISGGAL